METVVNTVNEEKKQNWFARKIEWWKQKNAEHPVKTKIITGLVGGGVLLLVGGGAYLIYKSCSSSGADNADYLMDGLSGVEPDHVNLPANLGFDCVKVVNEEGDILIESLTDMGGDYVVAGALNLPNIAHQIETATDINTVTESDLEAIQLAAAKVMDLYKSAVENI